MRGKRLVLEEASVLGRLTDSWSNSTNLGLASLMAR